MIEQMDAVDTRQQKEIDELRLVNERQDSTIKNVIWAFILFALIQFFTVLMWMYSTHLDCPHENCPHNYATKK